VEADLLRLFLVTAHKAGRPDCMAEFFRLYGPQLVSNSSRGSSSSTGPLGVQDTAADWKDWFLLPYLQSPDREARFQVCCTAVAQTALQGLWLVLAHGVNEAAQNAFQPTLPVPDQSSAKMDCMPIRHHTGYVLLL
jgi:hypothetical protein